MSQTTVSTQRTTDRLLACGIAAGPLYIAVVLGQVLTRDGFDLTRHSASILANGDQGWIQISNFLVAGALTIAAAVGLRRALGEGTGRTWGPRMLGLFGVGLLGAAVFRADPALGFPVGTPADYNEVSWHGMLHLVVGAVGFIGLIAACLIVARRFRSRGRRGLAAYSTTSGVLFGAAFVGIAAGAGRPAFTVGFAVAVVIGWAWVAVTSAYVRSHGDI
ncbi:MAG: DUF998 domain-containing protein [Propionibacteriales bacterium]|nr:DUF998 domain-containing protein [Propionibacteriales bacterium]